MDGRLTGSPVNRIRLTGRLVVATYPQIAVGLRLVAADQTFEQIHEDFPFLEAEDIRDALQYAAGGGAEGRARPSSRLT